MKKKLVFILGPNFCGSTLLGNALNGHHNFCHLGELNRLDIFKGLSFNNDIAVRDVDNCRICGSQDKKCTFWTPERLKKSEGQNIAEDYLAILSTIEEKVIIDSSKVVEWFSWCKGIIREQYDIYAIILARSPFGFSLSWKGASNQEVWQGTELWRNLYRHILCTVNGYSIPNLVIRYEDFSYNPTRSLQDIAVFIGEEYDNQMLHYWERPVHALGGNTSAYFRYRDFNPLDLVDSPQSGEHIKDERWKHEYYRNKPFGGWCSERWMEELSDDEMRQVIGIPMVTDIAMLLGYNVYDFILGRSNKLSGYVDK